MFHCSPDDWYALRSLPEMAYVDLDIHIGTEPGQFQATACVQLDLFEHWTKCSDKFKNRTCDPAPTIADAIRQAFRLSPYLLRSSNHYFPNPREFEKRVNAFGGNIHLYLGWDSEHDVMAHYSNWEWLMDEHGNHFGFAGGDKPSLSNKYGYDTAGRALYWLNQRL